MHRRHAANLGADRIPARARDARRHTGFLHPRGWFECKTADGQVSRADMPSTTPYHLATAYAALPAAS
jgi:mannose-6-phosphate isomerase